MGKCDSAMPNLRRIQELAGAVGAKIARGQRASGGKKKVTIIAAVWLETAVFRLKCIFGEKLSSRGFEAQANEVFLRCAALNRMTHLGMPQSYAI